MEDILKASFDDLPDELLLPSGTWRGTIKAIKRRYDRNNEPYTLLALSPVGACDDVDPEELSVWVEDGDPEAVVFHRIRGSERSQGAQLKRLGKSLDAENAGALIGKRVHFTISYDDNPENPDHPWQRVSGLIGVEE